MQDYCNFDFRGGLHGVATAATLLVLFASVDPDRVFTAAATSMPCECALTDSFCGGDECLCSQGDTHVPKTCQMNLSQRVVEGVNCPQLASEWDDHFLVTSTDTGVAHPPHWEWSACMRPVGVRSCPYVERPYCDPTGYAAQGRGVYFGGINLADKTADDVLAAVADLRVRLHVSYHSAAAVLAGKVGVAATAAVCGCARNLQLSASQAAGFFRFHYDAAAEAVRQRFDTERSRGAFDKLRRCYKTVMVDVFLDISLPAHPAPLGNASAFWAAALAENWGLASNELGSLRCPLCTASRTQMNIEMIRECTRTCSPDVSFVIDASGSVGHSNFHNVELKAVVSMGRAIGEDNFDVFAGGTHVTLVRFASCWNTRIVKAKEIQEAKSFDDFAAVVRSIRFTSGGTCTGYGMRIAYDSMVKNMRKNKPHFVFLLSDGGVSQIRPPKGGDFDISSSHPSWNIYAKQRHSRAVQAYQDDGIVSFGISVIPSGRYKFIVESVRNDVASDIDTPYGDRMASASWGNLSAVGRRVIRKACKLPPLLDPELLRIPPGEVRYFRLRFPRCEERFATLLLVPTGVVEISIAPNEPHPNPINAEYSIVTSKPFKHLTRGFWVNKTSREVFVAVVGLGTLEMSVEVATEDCCGERECFSRTETQTPTRSLTQTLPGWMEWRSPPCLPIATGAVGGIRLVLQVPAVPGSDRRVTLSRSPDCAGLQTANRLSSIERLDPVAATVAVNFQPLNNWVVPPDVATVCVKDESGNEGWQPVLRERPQFRLFHGAPRWTSVSPPRPEAGTPFVVELAGRSLQQTGLQAVIVEDTGKASCTGFDPLARAIAVADIVSDTVDTKYARYLAFNATTKGAAQARICLRHLGLGASDLWSSLPRGPRDEANSFRQCGFAIAPAVRPPDGSGCGLVAHLSRQPAVGAEVEVRLCVPRPGANVTAPTIPADCARPPPADCVVRVLDGTGEEMCPSPTLRPAAGSDPFAQFTFSAQRAGAMGAFRVLCGAAEQRLFVHSTPYEAEARRVLAEVGAIDPAEGPAGAPGQCGAPDDGVFRGSRDCGLRVPVDFSGSRFLVQAAGLGRRLLLGQPCSVSPSIAAGVTGGWRLIQDRLPHTVGALRVATTAGMQTLSMALNPTYQQSIDTTALLPNIGVSRSVSLAGAGSECAAVVDVYLSLPVSNIDDRLDALLDRDPTGTDTAVFAMLVVDVTAGETQSTGALMLGGGRWNETLAGGPAMRRQMARRAAGLLWAADNTTGPPALVYGNVWSSWAFSFPVPPGEPKAEVVLSLPASMAAALGWTLQFGGAHVVCGGANNAINSFASRVAQDELVALLVLSQILEVPERWNAVVDPCVGAGWPGVECRAGRIVAITVSQQSDDVLEMGPSRTRRTGDPVPLRFAKFSLLETLVLRGVEGRRPLVLDADSLRENFALRTLEVTGGGITVMPLVSAGTWRDDLRTPRASAELSWRPLQCLRQLSLRSVTAPEVPVPLGAVPDAVAFPDPQGDVMRLPQLRHLWLVDTGAKGGLPADLPALLPSLLTLDVSGNELSGDLPPLPPALFSALFRSNRFSGWVPEDWGTLHAVKSLDVGRNLLSFIPWEALTAKGNGGDAVFLMDGNPIAEQAIRPLPYGSYTLGNITWRCPLPRRDPSGWTGMSLLDYDALRCV